MYHFLKKVYNKDKKNHIKGSSWHEVCTIATDPILLSVS